MNTTTAPPRILLIRHTRVAVPDGTCYGQTDVPLAPTFEAEAAALRARLPWTPDETWSSPATRCKQLAEYLNAPLTHTDPRLLELNFGAWENRAWNDFHCPQSEAWARDPWTQRPPGGETAGEQWRRVGDFREQLLRHINTTPAARIAVVTHAGVIRAWRAHAQNTPFPQLFTLQIPFAHIEPGL
jgi:alpha-ribazole phosphatase